MNQLSLFDFVSTGEDQDEVIPVLKEGNQIAIVNQASQPTAELYQEMVMDPGRIAHLKRPQEKLPKCGAKEEVDDYGYIEKYTAKTNWLPLEYPVNDLAERCRDCFPPESKVYPMLTPVKWSVAGPITHLIEPGATTPICGVKDGPDGTYTATGEPYSWQTCVRGLTPMCRECAGLERSSGPS